jgi:hypothetical protein
VSKAAERVAPVRGETGALVRSGLCSSPLVATGCSSPLAELSGRPIA